MTLNRYVICLPWLLTAVLYAPVFCQLYRQRWDSIDYTHAYFIFPVALWLAWRNLRKPPLNIVPLPARSWLPAVFLISGLLIFILGWKEDYLSLSTLSLIPVLFGVSGMLYGPGIFKPLAFPVLYLLLMVPPPLGMLDSLTMPMRQWTGFITVGLLQALHYPVAREGLMIEIGGHKMFMGAACSGFRSLITMISLGIVYAYISRGGLLKKAILFASVIPLSLLGNFLRVSGVCLATYYLGEKAGKICHDISGYAIFLMLILGMIGLESLLERKR